MRIYSQPIIEITAHHGEEDCDWPMVPYGQHYGRGRDFSLRVDTIEAQFLIGSGGMLSLYTLELHGTRVQHLKAGLTPTHGGHVEILADRVRDVPGLNPIVNLLAALAKEKWIEIRGSARD